MAKLVEDKMKQFQEHFNYLFHSHSKAPIKINLINIENDQEVVRGILEWMVEQIKKAGLESAKTIEVSLYNSYNHESYFDLLSKLNSADEFLKCFEVDLTKDLDHDASDVLRVIQSRLLYFKRQWENSFEYAHISFYKIHAQEHHALLPMDDMVTGMALEGLYSYVPSMKSTENYRSGFGTKSFPIRSDNLLTEVAIHVNELCANLRNGGNDSYKKRASIVSRTTTADTKLLDQIYESSHWVTFIDSNVDLDFFSDSRGNLIVIHYSDQYSSSNKYDAITVTDKIDQYYSVIREFLTTKNVDAVDANIKHAIKAFNTFNGEWLLRIIGDKGHYSREKLSIISAIKYTLAYFDHPDIKWVPISLEEVLRVAGAVGLNKSDGVFTAKNLGVKGVHSDDLLLIGLENRNNNLTLHFYPVEVKIGLNGNDVIEKAKLQVKQTKQLIIKALSRESEQPFTAKFYRYFFVQLFLTNADKLNKGNFWQEKHYLIPDTIIEKLLADDFQISSDIERIIGEGAVLSFQRDAFYRSASLTDGVTIITLPEDDGYNGIIKPMQEMYNWIQVKESDFIKEKMLSHSYKRSEHVQVLVDSTTQYDSSNEKVTTTDETSYVAEEENKVNKSATSLIAEEADSPINQTVPDVEQQTNQPDKIQQIHLSNDSTASQGWRILLGRVENSNRNVYWEFGNSGLPNRHLLISGKSGQGKTYFMQCLLLEMSKLGISSIVVDYTEGFLPNQLEPEFKSYLGPKLKQRIVFNEQFPINPFKKNIRDIGGISLPESNTDVAERIKSVFASVYKSLGIQQLNAIYEAVLTGLDKYGDQMNLELLKAQLDEENSNYSKTALSQIRPLIDRNPFSKDNALQWNDILEADGEVFVIQLTGYPRDVQLTITEFILWDLWNYSLRFGQKNKPIPVLLDEAQNLDHSEHSPSAKILTEGRKFGWSGWYATQFLKSQLNVDEIARLQNASQKVYFAQPEQEVPYVANSLASDPTEKKRFESKLSSLKKGQCIIHGSVLKEDGTLSAPVATVVEILPLAERMK